MKTTHVRFARSALFLTSMRVATCLYQCTQFLTAHLTLERKHPLTCTFKHVRAE